LISPCETTAAAVPWKKYKDSVVNALKANPEFINPIAQKVGLGPPQFVAHFTQPLQPQEALVLDLCGQSAEPRQEWARSSSC